MAVDLSAIVITRNEEAHIAACLEGCLRAIGRAREDAVIRSAEVILSDSASTDQTVEIARRFPITIVQLLPDWPRSAGAGRHVGLRHAKGELVLFLDGDYVVSEDWLPKAVLALREHLDAAAVCGKDVEAFTGDSILLRYAKRLLDSTVTEPEAIPVGLYRRVAIDKAGGIHPFLKGAEDRDLAYRLRSAGYHLLRLPSVMGVHRWSDAGTLDYVTYFRSVLSWSIGDGQLFRARRRIPIVAKDMRRRYMSARFVWNYFLGIALVASVLANLGAALRMESLPILVLDAALLVTADAHRRSRRLSWREAAFGLHVIPYSLIRHAGFVLGFIRKPRLPDEYPLGERIVQTAGET